MLRCSRGWRASPVDFRLAPVWPCETWPGSSPRSAAALGAITLSLGIAVSVVVVAAANVPDADDGNLLADQMVVWSHSPDEFGGLQVPELTDDEVAQHEADVEEIAALASGALIVPLDVAVDPANSEITGGRQLRNNAVLGRPIDENTVRDSGVVFIATPELLDYLDLEADDQPPGAFLLTQQTGDVYITGNITQPVFIRDPSLTIGSHASTSRTSPRAPAP